MQSSIFTSSHRSWIKTFLLTLLFFGLIVSLCEVFLRGHWIQDRVNVPYPTQGYQSANTVIKALDDFVEENGDVDCIFLGSSLAAVGINPIAFEKAYIDQTGEAITCFNFGVSVATASSMGPLAHILVNNYHPKLLVFATAPRSYDGRASYNPEVNFQNTPWAKYHLGEFNLLGWVLDHSYTARYLTGLSEILFKDEETNIDQNEQVSRPREIAAKNVSGNYSPLLHFHEDAPLYQIKNNITVNRQKISQPFILSDDDFTGFKQIIELDQRPDLTLMVVELPSPKYFFLDPEGAPEPSEQTVFQHVIAKYAREHGVPFWTTNELNLIPYTFFSDGSHMYISGALDFSQWLGKEIGAVMSQQTLGGVIPEQYIDQPPLKDVDIVRDYYLVRGLSLENQKAYNDFQLQFDLVASDAVILNPLENALDRQFVQTILGFYIEWSKDVNQGNIRDWFALMAIQERMTTFKDAEFSSKQEQALEAWNSSKSPNLLVEAGVDYLLYTENWDDTATMPVNTPFNNPVNYRLIKYWDYPPLHETYYLYKPVNDQK